MRLGRTLAWIIGTAAASAALAAPADIISARQKNYKVIGKATKAIFDELKNSSPSVPLIQSNAKAVAGLAPQLPNWFPKGTGPEAGVKTEALPAIWQKNAEFQQDARNFAAAAAKLDAVAATGDLTQISAAARAMGGTCKACHDSFRQKE